MLHALCTVSKIETYLNSRLNKDIEDYRISIKLNFDMDIFILADINTSFSVKEFEKSITSNKKLSVTLLHRDDLEDYFYKSYFNNTGTRSDKVFHLRRRLDNQLSRKQTTNNRLPVPVITFYSYKGGVGRTTALTAFAMHYAIHEKKKVVLIDCDFEAPGITNFFGLQPTDNNSYGAFSKNGVIEYLSDREFLGEETTLNIDDYVISVPKDYAGEGSIYIVPAGNLSTKPISENLSDTHLDHYLEGLSRLNFSGTEQIIEQFSELLQQIEKQYNPDVILIDSRTGFNDVFANIGLSVSDIIIGLFSGNYQSVPGLHFVLSNPFIRKKLILVNSIISSGSDYKDFENLMRSEVIPNIPEEFEEPIIFPIYRNRLWELLGTNSEYKDDFIRIIRTKYSEDYEKLSKEIIYRLQSIDDAPLEGNVDSVQTASAQSQVEKPSEIQSQENAHRVTEPEYLSIANNMMGEEQPIDRRVALREEILHALEKHLPNLYAEQATYDDSFLRDEFYFRNCMDDLLSKDRFLICGAKGTGKTFLYRLLSTQGEFLDILKEREADRKGILEVQSITYKAINVISLKANYWEEPDQQKYLELGTFLSTDYDDEKNSDFFFKRFWLVYTWNAIFLHREQFESLFSLRTVLENDAGLKPQALKNEERDRKRFLALINDDTKIEIIEADLRAFDEKLKQHNVKLLLTYDQLDNIIKPNVPNVWSKGIAPLINYWAANTFSNIFPKLFIRRDLFDNLGNINNIQSLRNEIRMLSLDWKKEEIFGVFFKLVFAHTQKSFFELMRIYVQSNENNRTSLTEQHIQEIELAIDKKYNQIKQEEKYLRPLVETFFGSRVETGGYPVSTYDWFYKNLCNADGTISLRPFLDLIKYALANYFSNAAIVKYPMPILNQRDFTYGEVRKQAVDNHFKDIASEAGNEKLKLFVSYIQLHAPSSLKRSFLTKQQLNELVEKIRGNYPSELTKNTGQSSLFDEMRLLLISNGVVREVPSAGGYMNYSFAFLYKYYLGLSSKRVNS